MKIPVYLFIVSLLSSFVLTGTSVAEDWGQWRGEYRDGVVHSSPSLRNDLPEKGLEPVWRNIDLPAAEKGGWSSPVIADGKVYLFAHKKTKAAEGELGKAKYPYLSPEKRTGMTDEEYEAYEVHRRDEQEQRAKNYRFDETLYCLDADTGELLWKNVEPSVYTRFPQSGTPIVNAGMVYFLGAGRKARCVDAKSGASLWEKDLPGAFRDEFMQSSFVISKGLAIVQAGDVFGLNAKSGELVWRYESESDKIMHSSPMTWRDNVIVTIARGNTVCLKAATGKLVWEVKSEGGNATPIVQGDILITYGGSRKGGLRRFNLSENGAEHVWTFTGSADPGGSPVIVGDYVYVQGEKRLACVSLASGKAEWSTLLDFDRPRYTSLIAADGKGYYAFEGVLGFAATPEEYTELFNGKIDNTGLLAAETTFRKRLKMDELERTAEGQKQAERIWRDTFRQAGVLPCATPGLVDGRIYIRLKNGVACYDLK